MMNKFPLNEEQKKKRRKKLPLNKETNKKKKKVALERGTKKKEEKSSPWMRNTKKKKEKFPLDWGTKKKIKKVEHKKAQWQEENSYCNVSLTLSTSVVAYHLLSLNYIILTPEYSDMLK